MSIELSDGARFRRTAPAPPSAFRIYLIFAATDTERLRDHVAQRVVEDAHHVLDRLLRRAVATCDMEILGVVRRLFGKVIIGYTAARPIGRHMAYRVP